MTALTTTTEDTLQIGAREPRAMIEHSTRDNRTRETLTRGHFRPLRRLHGRAVQLRHHAREVILMVALFCILMMFVMMWMMMGGMSAFHGGRTHSHDTQRGARENDDKS